MVILGDDPRASKGSPSSNRAGTGWPSASGWSPRGWTSPGPSPGGFLTSYRTPLFFAQAVGRVVRARNPRETATVFLPAVRPLLSLAADLEEQRDHVVRISGPVSDDLDALEPPEDRADEPTAEGEFTPLTAEAAFAHVLHAGKAITAEAQPQDSEAEDYLGLPGLLTPEQTASLLASRDADLRRRTAGLVDSDPTRPSGRRRGARSRPCARRSTDWWRRSPPEPDASTPRSMSTYGRPCPAPGPRRPLSRYCWPAVTTCSIKPDNMPAPAA